MIPNVLLAVAIALVIAAGLGPIAEITRERRAHLALASLGASVASILVRFV